jgi:putative hydrolase of the HAD superfamily
VGPPVFTDTLGRVFRERDRVPLSAERYLRAVHVRTRPASPVKTSRRASATRAVIFDLLDTLADFDTEGASALERRIAERLNVEHSRFHECWWKTKSHLTGAVADSLRSIGAPEEALPELLALRLDFFRRTLLPRPGAIETLRALRGRRVRLGLVSECSEEVPTLWEETAFAGAFDSTVFSCSVALLKPDPRIFLCASTELDVEPAECLFVGDGGNDELRGAERAGMTAVLLERPELPSFASQRSWEGERIHSLADVLDLVVP